MDRLDRDARMTLIDARDAEPLTDGRSEAAWSRLQAAIAAGDRPVTEGESPPPAVRRRVWPIVVALAAALIIVVVGVEAVVGRRDVAASGQQAVHGAAVEAPQEVQVRRPVVEVGSDEPVLEDRSEPERARARTSRAAEDEVDLVAELALLRRAREALAGGRSDEALALLEQHAREFVGGHLGEERVSLRVRALCAAGSREAARAEAEAFVRDNPDSPHARKLLGVCSP